MKPMQVMEAIILAGGKGTRLQQAVPGIPKCLAPIRERPFLAYLIDYLSAQGIQRFVFSLGHQHQQVIDWVQTNLKHRETVLVVEDHPLGTGGAVHKAMNEIKGSHAFVLNGDSFFAADLHRMQQQHLVRGAVCSIAATHRADSSRYGTMTVDQSGRVLQFHEKRSGESGLINAGIYLLQATAFSQTNRPEAFSFEKDILEKCVAVTPVFASIHDGYFIDIGVPEDYRKAQLEADQWIPKLPN